MDCYDAIEIVRRYAHPDSPEELLANTAKRVADLWNDPPAFGTYEAVRDTFPQLADTLDELLGGGPTA